MKLKASILGASLFLTMGMVPFQTLAQGQDKLKDGIIRKAWEAMYGDLRPEDLHSIYYESYFHGREVPGKIYIQRPNRLRNESEGLTIIFDGERAAILRGSNPALVEADDIEPVDSVYLSHFEVDIALAFPAFFEYPSQLRGKTMVGTARCWEIFVDLPHGGQLTYFLDTASHLVIRRLVSWDGNPEQEPWENIIGGYHNYDGILFEKGYSFMGQEGQEEGHYRNARFNADLDSTLFHIPER